MSVSIGDPAPAFELANQYRQPVSVDKLRGTKSLVVFIPFPFTGVCTGEVCTIRDHLAELSLLDAEVLVVTTHAAQTNRAWADANELAFDVLADYWPHGAVAQAYGAFNEVLGVANRVTYVLDRDLVVRDIIATDSLGIGREFETYIAALAAI
jgi:peroxiredoxin